MTSCCVLSLRLRSGGGEGSFSGLGSAKHADWVEVRFVETFSPGYVTAEISWKVEIFWSCVRNKVIFLLAGAVNSLSPPL